MRLLLDVDCGVDDALAILLACAWPECELAAVTAVAGNTDVASAARNAAGVLGLAFPWGDAPAVAVGAARPLRRGWRKASEFHGPDGLAGLSSGLPHRVVRVDERPADEVIVDLAREGGLHVVATGPLTNLALALRREERLPELVERLTVMGGAYWVGGNETPHAEYNVWVDPDAAAEVFAAGFNLTAVGLDVTMKAMLRRDRLPPRSMRPSSALARRLVVYYMAREAAQTGAPGAYLHDPLAVAAALGLVDVRTRRCAVTVDVEGECRGRTRACDSAEAATQVAVSVDAGAFVRLFCDRVLGRDRG